MALKRSARWYKNLVKLVDENEPGEVWVYDWEGGDAITPDDCTRYVIVQRDDSNQECRYAAGNTRDALLSTLHYRLFCDDEGWYVHAVWDLERNVEVKDNQTVTLEEE